MECVWNGLFILTFNSIITIFFIGLNMRFNSKILNEFISTEVANTSQNLKYLLWVNIVIYLIFIFLEPFNFNIIGYNKYIVSFIFVLSYYLSLFISIKFVIPYFRKITNIKKLYFYHYILGYFFLIIVVAITHQLLQNILNGDAWFEFNQFFKTISNAFFIGFIPTIIVALIKYISLIEKQIKHTNLGINNSLKKYPQSGILTIESSNKKNVYRFDKTAILYMNSEDNYVGVKFFNDNNILEKELIRIPLKTVESFIEFPLLKVHRSYVVNLNQITKISGNSQGMQIALKGIDELIPVSRNYIEPLKNTIQTNA